eukprot:CAMPEP_0172297266 /NCGR_PEP_ID=MMETSP1058-20130122/353_1 /TAXON_ID=83371 /ORGANISM="Detonula confervacea, Strain CCMP 353" /LENGTH=498 /DNA_ID=CAMNT_0013006395 /DNA_START=131 /DNA_END=1630 /DNA_ORIENTATION=+
MFISAACHVAAFQHTTTQLSPRMAINNGIRNNEVSIPTSPRRRHSVSMMAGGFLSGLFGDGDDSSSSNAAYAATDGNAKVVNSGKGPTNEVVKSVNGMRQRRLGGSDIVVSELGLGTQRWISSDFNAPNKDEVFEFMDKAILKSGVNLIDTAEQYPIPSDGKTASEGDSELAIGEWMKSRGLDKGESRKKVVIATKIGGGRNITPKNIKKNCDESLKRLGTDYIDVYQLHWPARYSPQSNWGQSLAYNIETDKSGYWRSGGGATSFEDLCISMQGLIDDGKIRGWGLCNDNAYGLTGCTRTAKALGVTPPCSIQGDFSLIDRKSEENGVAEAASPYNENVGFMAYNTLAGGMLTGKYMDKPAALDNTEREKVIEAMKNPRGRMDEFGWSRTLYRYRSEAAQEAIREYSKIAKRAGMSLTELSLRWSRQRSMITTTLVGHSNMDQLQQSIDFFTKSKPLSDDIMWEIDIVHMKNRLPIFSSDRVGKDWDGEGEIGETIP